MVRRFFIAVLVVIIGISLASAGDIEEKGGWWKKLRSKIEKLTPKNEKFTTAVGGVRGAREEGSDELYWKGLKKEPAVDEKELGEFQAALDLAVEGRNDEALKAFEEFLRSYPESALREDAEGAVERLKPEQ
jgi:TolA-binding protein